MGEAGVYLTRIVDRKTSHGDTFLVTDGGLHHQLAASGNFGTVVRRNYPVAVAGRFGAAPTRSAMLFLGAGTRHPALHNPDYDFPDDLIPIAAHLFDRIARDILG